MVNHWVFDCVHALVATFVPIMSLLESKWVSLRGSARNMFVYIQSNIFKQNLDYNRKKTSNCIVVFQPKHREVVCVRQAMLFVIHSTKDLIEATLKAIMFFEILASYVFYCSV